MVPTKSGSGHRRKRPVTAEQHPANMKADPRGLVFFFWGPVAHSYYDWTT